MDPLDPRDVCLFMYSPEVSYHAAFFNYLKTLKARPPPFLETQTEAHLILAHDVCRPGPFQKRALRVLSTSLINSEEE